MPATMNTIGGSEDAKVMLLDAILAVVKERGWNQTQTAAVLRSNQSRVSELHRRKLRQISLDKLIEYARILGLDVQLYLNDERSV